MKKSNNSWYSVILAILMVWFMLVLSSWIFLLIMQESKDTKAMEYYLKAFAWAEWSLELAMLKAKKYNYSYDEKLQNNSSLSKVLYGSWEYKKTKDVTISYDLSSISNEIKDKNLKSAEFDIIPLFHYDINGNYKKVTNITISWLNADIVWNIIWEREWISWIWNFSNTSNWNLKTISSWVVSFSSKSIWDFLQTSEKNYLILHNTSPNNITYTLNSLVEWEFLTKEITQIIWSWEVWGYKQNLRVNINNSKYLNLLKYSIFSN